MKWFPMYGVLILLGSFSVNAYDFNDNAQSTDDPIKVLFPYYDHYYKPYLIEYSETYIQPHSKGWYWLENSDVLDCVCGISYASRPMGIGVFFDKNLVLTSATIIEPLSDLTKMFVYSIYGAYDNSAIWPVVCATTPYKEQRKERGIKWHPLGYDSKHSGLHDLMVLYVDSENNYDLAPEASNAIYRHAFSMHMAMWNQSLLPSGFVIPGFGFIDEDHVKRMNVMEIELYGQPVLVDCDDYFPRDWGRFICIANFRNAIGVQSGAPLIQRNLIYGIGSFALQKGEERILVFTDVRDYLTNFHYCRYPNDIRRWKSRYWTEKKSKS